jgi:adenylate kinase
MLRDEIRRQTRLGKQVTSMIQSGQFAGDSLMNRMVLKRLSLEDCAKGGFLLDGYPRTVPQAQFLHKLIEKRRWPAPLVVHLQVPEQTLVERLSGRRQCSHCQTSYNLYTAPPPKEGRCACGKVLVEREDDRPAVVKERLRAYKLQTDPVLDYYREGRGQVLAIDGDQQPGTVFAEIQAAVEDRMAPVTALRARAL